MVHWSGAVDLWITLNSDGSVLWPSIRVTAKGVIRNHVGQILQTYSLNLGQCSITRVELRGAVEDMHIA
ncbi:hypothetical protein LINGRAHAP2_LOCUS23173 [Linum grandiflorum]